MVCEILIIAFNYNSTTDSSDTQDGACISRVGRFKSVRFKSLISIAI